MSDFYHIITSRDWTSLEPNDEVLVYHGTSLSNIPHFINGFDALKTVSRLYGGSKHKGLFVSPDFKTAQRFASRGELVLELKVKAKNLHGTDYSGNIGRYRDFPEEHKRSLQNKYPNSFRPYLSETLSLKVEPQALLLGLISPDQITRIWYDPSKKDEGKWYTREGFIALDLETGNGYEPKKKIKDIGYDLSYPNYDISEFVGIVAQRFNKSEDRILRYFKAHASKGEEYLRDVIERQLNFGPTAAKSYTKKLIKHFEAGKVASRIAHRITRTSSVSNRVVDRYYRKQSHNDNDDNDTFEEPCRTGGTCYQDAANYILDKASNNAVMIHGRPTLRVAPFKEYGHAWIEEGNTVIDPSVDVQMPKPIYYALGNIDSRKNLIYTKEETRQFLLSHGHYGPWEGPEASEPLPEAKKRWMEDQDEMPSRSKTSKVAINMEYFDRQDEVPWKFMDIPPYKWAINQLREPLVLWITSPSQKNKQRILDVWEDFHPELKQALDEANERVMGSKSICWRVAREGKFPTDLGGFSLHDKLEPEIAKSFIKNPYEPFDDWELSEKIRAYEVKPKDVLTHYRTPDNPLGEGHWRWEFEIILKPGANPKRITDEEAVLIHLSNLI